MHQRDPRRKNSKEVIITLLCLGCIGLALLLIFGRSADGTYGADMVLFIVLCGVLVLLGIVMLFTFLRTSRAKDQIKERAMHGDQKLLAAEQPVANENALPLPTTIKLQLKKKRFLLSTGILYAVMYGLLSFFLLDQGHKSLLSHIIAACISGLLFALLMTPINYFFIGRRAGHVITVDDQGITVTSNSLTIQR